jgi:thioesterase domain-containing protein
MGRMETTQPGDLDELTAGVQALVPILGQMGITIIDASHGRAAAVLPAGPNGNHFGTTYAGSLFSVAEMLGGVIGFNTFALAGFVPLVKSLDISFLRPATTDVTATTSLSEEEIARIEAEALATGRAQFVLEAVVTDAAGEVVATTSGVYQLRKF